MSRLELVRGSDGRHTIDFTPHPEANKLEKGEKVVYYQTNPLPNWGPAARARTVKVGSGAEASAQLQAAKVQSGVPIVAQTEPVGETDVSKRKADEKTDEPAPKKAKIEVEADEDEEEAMNMA
jgi:hypothetical protein